MVVNRGEPVSEILRPTPDFSLSQSHLVRIDGKAASTMHLLDNINATAGNLALGFHPIPC